MSDHDSDGMPDPAAEAVTAPPAKPAASKAVDARAQRTARLAAALRTNLRRRKAPAATARHTPGDKH